MTSVKKHNRRVLVVLLAVVVGMSGFGFVLIPLYRVMSNVYGFGGERQQSDEAKQASRREHAMHAGVDKTRTINLQFAVIDNSELPVEFRPMQRQLDMHPGELREVNFYLRNLSNRELQVQGLASVTPGVGARYLVSMGSMCCKHIALEAGQSRTLAVQVVIDPDVPARIQELTLGYRLVTH